MDANDTLAKQVLDHLERIEFTLANLLAKQADRDWYSTDQAALILGRSEFTVREWCRLKRIRAEKRLSGRGAHSAWAISHAELLRFQREGLLPLKVG